MLFFPHFRTSFWALLSLVFLSACGANDTRMPAEAGTGLENAADAFDPVPVIRPNEPPLETSHPNAIQPETTLSIVGRGEVARVPDLAIIMAGVEHSAPRAGEAMARNRAAMSGVFEALKAAGIDEGDMQTADFSLQPQYDYSSRDAGQGPRLIGYRAANSLTVRVRQLDRLGATMDALVEAGGNTFSGLQFTMEDPREAKNQARRDAIGDALSKAELYAAEAGYTVARIVTLSELEGDSGARPMMMAVRAQDRSETTPIAGGEVRYDVQVQVEFELRK